MSLTTARIAFRAIAEAVMDVPIATPAGVWSAKSGKRGRHGDRDPLVNRGSRHWDCGGLRPGRRNTGRTRYPDCRERPARFMAGS